MEGSCLLALEAQGAGYLIMIVLLLALYPVFDRVIHCQNLRAVEPRFWSWVFPEFSASYKNKSDSVCCCVLTFCYPFTFDAFLF